MLLRAVWGLSILVGVLKLVTDCDLRPDNYFGYIFGLGSITVLGFIEVIVAVLRNVPGIEGCLRALIVVWMPLRLYLRRISS